MSWDDILTPEEELSCTVSTAGDGLVASLRALGRVDIQYISDACGLSKDKVIEDLKGSVYQDPKCFNANWYEGYKTADDYLSGNLWVKLEEARRANKMYPGLFQKNIDAILSVLPKAVTSGNIYFTLASPWIPEDIIEGFILHILSFPNSLLKTYVKHDPLTGTWEVRVPSAFTMGKADYAYGTSRIRANKIVERILNNRDMAIYDTLNTPSGTKQKLNKADTLMAAAKAELIQQKFHDYVENRPELKSRLTRAYNERYGFNVVRRYNGDFLEFPKLSAQFDPYKYQRDAVARIIFNSNTLLAHEVGTGKTLIMAAAAEELTRMGLSQKNLFVLPNSIVGQWERAYYSMYPEARVLVTTPKDYTPLKREKTLARIRDEEYTSILMPYSAFDSIPLSRDIELRKLREELEEIDRLLKRKDTATQALSTHRKVLEKKLAKLEATPEDTSHIYFNELGITRLFVDEAHNYKNVPIETNMSYVQGLNLEGSRKCTHMLNIVDYMNSVPTNGVIMATGTPVTNSVSDIYTFQRYLQPGELTLMDIHSFDDWITMFAENHDELEIDVDTSNYRLRRRFSRFHNLTELTQILAGIADFYFNPDSADLPIFRGYTDVVIPKSKELKEYLQQISVRVDQIRKGALNRKEDNLLKVTTDGRKAALDLRLIDSNAYSFGNQKIITCAEQVAKVYFDTAFERGAQIIFCDTSTPKDDFNVYDEMRKDLEALGIPGTEIAYIHDATTEKKRDAIFKAMNQGALRVLIGSTFKLGLGVNVQERLVAIHHLDIPWRPADMVQRNGRILRQGNTSPEVFIYRYITEGSFDAYSWQILETKQAFIHELLSNSVSERNREDIQDTVLSYGEVKALAIGNPRLKEHVALRNQLSRLKIMDMRSREREATYRRSLLEIPARRKTLEESLANAKDDMVHFFLSRRELGKEERLLVRKAVWNGLLEHLDSDTEQEIVSYQGFAIVAPAHNMNGNLGLYIVGRGRYYLSLGNSEIGCLVRCDNFLEELPKLVQKYENDLESLSKEEATIQAELADRPDYQAEMELLVIQINKLEKELKL